LKPIWLTKPNEKWPALEAINNEVARKWDERLLSFPRQKDKSVPDGFDCLWYLPDRAEQKDRLCEAIQAHEKTTIHQPLLCLIHGNEQEAHDKFKECVIDKELPRLNKLYRSDGNKGIWKIDSFSVNFKNISELQNEVLKKLVERMLYNYPDDQEQAIAKIAKRLSEEGRPVILWIKIFTKYCQYQHGLIEQGILDFWAKWPKTNKRNYRLLVFLSFHYPDKNKMELNLKKLFNQFFQRRFTLTHELSQWEDDYPDWNQKNQSLRLVVLPELRPIDEAAVSLWLENDCPDYFSNTRIQAARLEMRKFYKKHPKGVPMATLAKKLKDILQKVTKAST